MTRLTFMNNNEVPSSKSSENKTDGELRSSKHLRGLQAYPQMLKENRGLVN